MSRECDLSYSQGSARMRIIVDTIPHDEQRSEIGGSVADWQYGRVPHNRTPMLKISVSDQGDWRKEACLAIHELVEALICAHLGVTDAQVDEFDREWKENGNY